MQKAPGGLAGSFSIVVRSQPGSTRDVAFCVARRTSVNQLEKRRREPESRYAIRRVLITLVICSTRRKTRVKVAKFGTSSVRYRGMTLS